MYEVLNDVVTVNNMVVDTFERNVIGTNTLYKAKAGTTGYTGGDDRDSGSRAYVSIDNICGDFFARLKKENCSVSGVELAVCGDDAIRGLIKSLEFTVKVLKDQIAEVDD